MEQKPSKKFIRIAILVLLVLGFTAFSQTQIGKKVFTPKKTGLQPLVPKNQTLGEIIGTDQNKNGIADWEERLYGLDPSVLSTNGISNKDIVLQKREAAKNDGVVGSVQNTTDTLTYNIYAASSILNDAGNIDNNTLQGVVAPLVKNSIKQVQTKNYTSNDVLLVQTNTQNVDNYTKKLQQATAAVSFDQNEIDLITTALQKNDYSTLSTLAKSAASYQTLAAKIINLQVPIAFARPHLDFANSLRTIGDTLIAASKINEDDIQGASAIAQYSNETIVLQASMDNLTQTIQDYVTMQAQ